MRYFIAINGKVYQDDASNMDLPRLEIDNNLFERREEAHFASFELEEKHPRIFYGKPATKTGLRRYASGDTTATYRKRT